MKSHDDKIEELAHEGATVVEDFCDVANGEFVGFDFAAAKGVFIQILHRYATYLEGARNHKGRGTTPILIQSK